MKLAPWYTHKVLGIKPTIEFVAHENLPLPNPEYLRVHAACCRVHHRSGAGRYIKKILREVEELQVLEEDGSSADVLAFCLQRLSAVYHA